MRLFIAAELPEGLREALAETSALLRGCVRGRYVASDSLHVTLTFLGEVDGCRAESAIDALEEGCRGFASFPVSFGDLGCFGRRKAATLWQGFGEAGDLPALAESVRDALRERDFSFDEKSFLPHVTLMRKVDLTSGTLPSPVQASGVIENITLFRSDLSGSRPIYDPMHTVTLGWSGR